MRASKIAPGLLNLAGPFTKIARTMSSNWGVEVIPSGTRCETDGQRIFIPFTADYLPEAQQQILHGHLDHEVSHVMEERAHKDAGRETPLDVMRALKKAGGRVNRILMMLLNAYEDIRIEAKNGAKYPGMRENLAKANVHAMAAFRRRTEADRAKASFWGELVCGIIAAARGEDTSWLRPDVAPYLDLIGDELDAIQNARWVQDCLELARQTYDKVSAKAAKAMEDEARREDEPEPPPPPPPAPEPEGGQEEEPAPEPPPNEDEQERSEGDEDSDESGEGDSDEDEAPEADEAGKSSGAEDSDEDGDESSDAGDGNDEEGASDEDGGSAADASDEDEQEGTEDEGDEVGPGGEPEDAASQPEDGQEEEPGESSETAEQDDEGESDGDGSGDTDEGGDESTSDAGGDEAADTSGEEATEADGSATEEQPDGDDGAEAGDDSDGVSGGEPAGGDEASEDGAEEGESGDTGEPSGPDEDAPGDSSGDESDGQFEAGAEGALEDDSPVDDIFSAIREEMESAVVDDIKRHGRYVPNPHAQKMDAFIEPAWRDQARCLPPLPGEAGFLGEEALKARALANVNNAYNDVSDQVGALRGRQQALLQTMTRRRVQPGLDAGRLDDTALAGVRLGDRHVFTDIAKKVAIDTAVEVLIDLSGSMGSGDCRDNAAYYAKRASLALAESWEAIKLPYEMIGFYNDHTGPYDWTKPPPGTQPRAPFRFPVFKAWNERLAQCRERWVEIRGRWDNCDGEAVLAAARRLIPRKEQRRILVVISDGMPACGSVPRDVLHQHLCQTVKLITSSGIEVWGVGAGTDAPRYFYNKETGATNIIIKDLKVLAETMFAAIGNRITVA